MSDMTRSLKPSSLLPKMQNDKFKCFTRISLVKFAYGKVEFPVARGKIYLKSRRHEPKMIPSARPDLKGISHSTTGVEVKRAFFGLFAFISVKFGK